MKKLFKKEDTKIKMLNKNLRKMNLEKVKE